MDTVGRAMVHRKGKRGTRKVERRKERVGKEGGKRYFSWLDNKKTNSKKEQTRGRGQEDNGQFKP